MTASPYFRERIAMLRIGRQELIVALGAFFDDAGTSDRDRYVSWGGFIGTGEQWEAMDGPWRARLAKPFDKPEHARPPLSMFHLSKCKGHHGEFEGYSDAESDALQRSFRDLIAAAGVVGLAYAIDKQMYDKLVQGKAREFFGDAEEMCFGSCFKGAMQTAHEHFPEQERMAIVFDRVGQQGRMDRLNALVDRYVEFDRKPTDRPLVGDVSFAKVVDWTPLQAADIIATENAWALRDFLAGAEFRAQFKSFLGEVHTDGFMVGEPELIDTLERYGFKPA